MITLDVIQNSPEWFAARCGIPTSSNFDKIVDSKGNPSKQRQKYLYRLAGEAITKISEETYQNGNMVRGQELEEEARSYYAMLNNVSVKQVGFCLNEKPKFGASPDGLIGKIGVLEIKCPLAPAHIGYLLSQSLPVEYFQQLQGQLLVTGRKWVDFMSYYPKMKPMIIRVKPDKKFQKLLETELKRFCVDLEKLIKKIK